MPFSCRSLRIVAVSVLALVGLAVASACGGDEAGTAAPRHEAKPATCPEAWHPGWERLAERVGIAVYCPSWLPSPLTGELGGEWHSTRSVRRDGSYLMGFIWFERGIGEVHVNLRAYPNRLEIPKCDGKPCFSDPRDPRHVAGIDITPYSVNRGADTWHLLYAWEREGSLYTVSQHVVPDLGLSYGKVQSNLDRIVAGLDLIEPRRA